MSFKHKALAYFLALTLLVPIAYTGIYIEDAVAAADSASDDAGASSADDDPEFLGEEPANDDEAEASEDEPSLDADAENPDAAAPSDDNAESSVMTEEGNNEVKAVPKNIADILQSLGLLEDGETDSEEHITRGLAAGILFRFEREYEVGTATGGIYSDVTQETPYAYEIELLSTLGYFFGTGEGQFSPDRDITPVQMATVLLRLAGYPDSAISASSELSKVLKNSGGYEYLTYQGLANMLYNFLDVNIIKLDNYSPTDSRYVKSSTETVLSRYLDVEKFKGVVTENDITGLWSGSDLGKNKVLISGKEENLIIDAGKTDVDLMIGRYIEVYYRYDDAEAFSVCVAYDTLDKNNEITEISLYDIDYGATSAAKIVYYPDENKRRQVNCGRSTAILYNGTYYSSAQSVFDRIEGKTGKITVIDNNSDGTADVLDVEAYDICIVSSVLINSGDVFFKNTNQTLNLEKDNYDRISITDESGNETFIEDFVEGTVISAAKSDDTADKKVIKVFVTTQKISGVVTEVYKNHMGRDVIRLDSMKDYLLSNPLSLPDVGQGVIASLDAFGNIAALDYSNAGGFLYGIITEVKLNKRAAGVSVKMITAKNTIEKFEVSNKLVVDKDSYKDMDALYNKLYNLF